MIKRPNNLFCRKKRIRKQVCFSPIDLLDLPVTFHKKIKSSGYSAAPTSLKYSKSHKPTNSTKNDKKSGLSAQDIFRTSCPSILSVLD